MDKLKSILKFAMRMEKDAGNFYGYYMDKAQSEATRKLFEELAGIEKQHYLLLEEAYEKFGFIDPPQSISWVVDDIFAARDPHIIADNSDITQGTDNEVSDLTIIRMAYLIENDFSLFYKNAIKSVDDKAAKKILSKLSDWEDKHREMFYERYQSLLKKYWSDISSIIFAD